MSSAVFPLVVLSNRGPLSFSHDDTGRLIARRGGRGLVATPLAKLRPDRRPAVFLHTPFCSPTELAVLPDRVAEAMLAGLSGAGAVGFHTARWAAAFEACCRGRLDSAPPTFVAPAAADA